ncbi:hypothetical protein DFH07DRAFT_967624 [Mycena maculata]|uniref:DUF6534 domain-containing protein n=1 Tax=Mycena maculata TaxID=230809 RepID=A0AAD7I3S6_9AGAR|nr:hypothetical protein DFH07DRAFT_967624 [Mycena maculata]
MFQLLSGRNSSRPAYNSMLSRLTRIIVETNALTAGVAVVAITLFWGFPGIVLVSIPIAIIGKLYTNCLLALFNNRTRETAKSVNSHGLVSLHVSSNHASQPTSNSHLESLKVDVVSQMDISYESQMELGHIEKTTPDHPYAYQDRRC